MKRVAIVQSSYIPWKGYFDLIGRVDELVLFDEVQYTRRDWRNRNRIKTRDGLRWLTVPTHGRRDQRIDEVRVSDPGWGERHWRSLLHAYARAPHFADYGPRVCELYERARVPRLSELNEILIRGICAMLGIATPITRSTDYPGPGRRTDRLLGICLQAGATEYLSGPAARAYLAEDRFTEAGVAVAYMDYLGYPEYPQLHPPFEHRVTVLDLIFHTGPEAARYATSTSAAAAPAGAR